MKVNEVIEKLNCKVLTDICAEKEVNGIYICDLLSLAMTKVSEGDLWITVQANVNIVAVAVLTEASCILIAENMNVEQDVIDKANAQGVLILKTEKSAYEAAMIIGNEL